MDVLPEYDHTIAEQTNDWATVPGAPGVLHDVPTHSVFCTRVITITDRDPVLLIGKPWRHPNQGHRRPRRLSSGEWPTSSLVG
jgi:hypothetical protein